MADLFFSRDTKFYIEQEDTVNSTMNVWEIPILDGYSFSQSTNSTEITLNEMTATDGTSRRARMMFNDSYAPAEFSITTYLRPFISAADATGENWGASANHHLVEEVLFAALVSNNSWDTTAETWTDTAVTAGTSDISIDFSSSNKSHLGTFSAYFVLGGCDSSQVSDPTIYKIAKSVINSAEISFDIDGIAQITWNCMGSIISDEASEPTATITEGTTATSNFIRNRLTTLAVTANDTSTFPGAGSGDYNCVLTGGSITFENNISFLTPETLCTVNQPLEHVTGARNISGNFTTYLSNENGGSADLFDDLISVTDKINNSFNLVFSIGGSSAPNVQVTFPQAHLEIPSHSIDDVIAVDTSFNALPSSMDGTDEATITAVGDAL